MVIVALVGTDLHIRIFDASGKKVVDKAENELVSGETLTALKTQLNLVSDESGLSKEDKQNIIAHATSIAGHTRGKSHVAGLYFFYKLDCLIDLAYKVSHDFYDRPELFTDLADAQGATIAPTLAKLHARYGTDERFLNKKQRHAIYSALFEKSASMESSTDEEGNFQKLRDVLIDACAKFAETKFGDEASLREIVKQKHIEYKQYLKRLEGASVAWSRDGALDQLTEQFSYRILRNEGVPAVYGVRKPARDTWPYDFDANAEKLVEKISQYLLRLENSEELDADGKQEWCKCISQQDIVKLQRAAIEGAKAITTVIDVDSNSNDADINRLITKCYAWGTALKNLSPQKAVEPRRPPAAAISSESRPGTYGRS